MKKKYGALTALLVVLALAMLLGLGGCGRNDTPTKQVIDQLMPEQMSSRLQLRTGEISREVQYAADKTTKVSATIKYKSEDGKGPGKIALIEYRTGDPGKGTIKHVKLFYPAASVQTAQLAREISIGIDGKTFTSDLVKRVDGTVEHVGTMFANIYETVDYRQDGTTISRHRKFTFADDLWTVSFEEQFFPGGRLWQSLHTEDDGTINIDEFEDTDAHPLLAHSEVNQWRTHVTTERFEADGKTVAQHIEEDSFAVTIDSFHAGHQVESRAFSYGFGSLELPNGMTVSVYDDNGKIKFTQDWSVEWNLRQAREAAGNLNVDASLFSLSAVHIMDADGKESKQIRFKEDGKTVDAVEIYSVPGDTVPRVEKEFRDDGTLSEVTSVDANFNRQVTETHTADEKIVEPVDQDLLVARPFTSPVRTLKRFESVPE